MGSNLAEWTRKMTQYPFFQHAVPLTLAQARRESELEILLQSMLLMDAKDTGYNYKSISMREVMVYCQVIRGIYLEQRRMTIQTVIEYLSEAFTEKHKFLRKSNVPMVFIMADIAMAKDISPKDFKSFIDNFSSNISPDYEENMGSGNIKRAKTEGRLMAIFESMLEYFGISEDRSDYPIYREEVGIVSRVNRQNHQDRQ